MVSLFRLMLVILICGDACTCCFVDLIVVVWVGVVWIVNLLIWFVFGLCVFIVSDWLFNFGFNWFGVVSLF